MKTFDGEEMKVTYIDPTGRTLYAGLLPGGGGYGILVQNGMEAPRRLEDDAVRKEPHRDMDSADRELVLYVDKRRDAFGENWGVLVNGVKVKWKDLDAIIYGEIPLPDAFPVPAATVTLANIEYRIATHIQGAYENILEVGRCLNEAKDAGLVAHGQWEAWVRQNTGMSERNAQKLMQAARSVNAGSMMNKLPISKIQAILALPEDEREPMAEKAVADDMSLRELQEAVKAQKVAEKKAEAYKIAQQQSEARAAKAEKQLKEFEKDIPKLAENMANEYIEQLTEEMRDERTEELAQEIEALRAELAQAQQAAPAEDISDDVQAEIERLKAELADAEAYAEQQAALRQQVQQELLNQRAEGVRGDGAQPSRFGASDLAAAVRAFIGTAGVLPHMGIDAAQISEAERVQMRQYVDMVDAWVDGSRRALDAEIIGVEG